jgi:hypothetical protein
MCGGGHSVDVETMVAALERIDPASLNDDELAAGCLNATALMDATLAYVAAMVAEFQQRGSWAEDGALSAATWIANRTGTRRNELAQMARVGGALRQLPDAEAAARAGEMGFDHARRLADCVRAHPATAARDAEVLLEQARGLDANTFRTVVRHWIALADDEAGNVPEELPVEPRHSAVHLSKMADGWFRLDGSLRPDHGEVLNAVLEEHVDRQLRAQRDGDPSLTQMLPSALRAEALVDLAAQHCRREPSEESVPDRYRVGITFDLQDLQAAPFACCDSSLYRVVTVEGEILDMGRTSRTWTTGIRRGVTHRDGGCVFPGCDRPPSWCDIHHCTHWQLGGTTSLDNGALLCRRHHTFIHDNQWQVVIPCARGKPEVHRPDGTRYTIHRWRLDSARSG